MLQPEFSINNFLIADSLLFIFPVLIFSLILLQVLQSVTGVTCVTLVTDVTGVTPCNTFYNFSLTLNIMK
jgi:hypothetical protein